MSVHISSAVWKIVMPNPGRKLVAVALADMANDDGVCWPSLKTLAARCSMREETIRNHLESLAVVGILNRSPRFQAGRQTSNLYAFAPLTKLCGINLIKGGEGGEVRYPSEVYQGSEKQKGEGSEKQEGGGGRKTPPQEPSDRIIIKPSLIPPEPPAPQSLKLVIEESKPILTAEQIEIGSWLNRRSTTPWNDKERKAWAKITKPFDSDDWAALRWYYTESGCGYLRRDLFTLLNNWNGEIDRAKNYNPEQK